MPREWDRLNRRRRLVLVACAMLAWLPPAVAGQQAPFRSSAVAVRLDVLVQDERRQPVAGLSAQDFIVLDNGTPQTPFLVEPSSLPVNVTLAIDFSGSVAGDSFEKLKAAVRTVLTSARSEDEVRLVVFNQRIVANPAAGIDDLADRLGRLTAGGKTSLRDAIYTGLAAAAGGPARRILLVFSDGLDTSSWLRQEDVVRAARRSNVVIQGVTVGAPADSALRELARVTGGEMLRAERAEALQGAFSRIMRQFRSRYVIGYTPTGVSAEGWHSVTVRARSGRYVVVAREGYFAQKRD